MLDDLPRLLLVGTQRHIKEFGNVLQGGASKYRRVVEATVDNKIFMGKGFAHVLEGFCPFLSDQLVRHDDADFCSLHFVQCQVHADIIYGVADAAAADNQDRSIEQAGNPGVT